MSATWAARWKAAAHANRLRFRLWQETARNRMAMIDNLAVDVAGLRAERADALATLCGCTPEATAGLDLVAECERMVGAEVVAEEVSEALAGEPVDGFDEGAAIAREVAGWRALLVRALDHVQGTTEADELYNDINAAMGASS